MASGDEPPSGDRPRWSFTWLLRIQRIGRDRALRREAEGGQSLLTHWLFWVLLAVVGLEAIALVLLDVLPLN